jgi:DnaJ homolog subfamily C member 28
MPEDPERRPPVKRRDAEGRLQIGPTWEALVDRQIREAMEAGKFDDLPYRGEPLPNDDNPHAGDWALAFHMLRNAGIAPPWIETDKEVRALLQQRDAILARAARGSAPSAIERRRGRDALEDLVPRINAAIAVVNAGAPTPRQHRRPLALADELARYEATCDRPPADAEPDA